MTEESIMIVKLNQVWTEIFPNNIKFIASASLSDFPYPLFLDDKQINCAYHIERDDITASLRIWLSENIEHTLYIISRDHSCYYGLHFFFVGPEDATKFAMAFGDIIHKVE